LIFQDVETLNMERRSPGTTTQAKRKIPANRNPPTSHVRRLAIPAVPGCEMLDARGLVATAGAPDDFVSPAAAWSFCPVGTVEAIGASEGAAATGVEQADDCGDAHRRLLALPAQ